MSGHREGLSVEPLDPDIGLITRYLAKVLTPAEASAVENRYKVDAAFREKVVPLAALWILPGGPVGRSIDEELDAFEAEAAAEAAAVVVAESQAALTAPPPKLMPATPPALTATRRWWAWAPGGWRVAVTTIRSVLGKLIVVFIGAAVAAYGYEMAHRAPAPAPAFAPASAVPGAGGAPGSAPTTNRAAGVLHPPADATRIVVPLDSAARTVEPGPGLRLVVPPGSNLAFKSIGDGIVYNVWYEGGRGDASIEVAEPVRTVNLMTKAGRAQFNRGRYSVQATGGDFAETQFTVIAGKAFAFGAGNKVFRVVDPGERAIIHVSERPTTTPAPAARPPKP